MRFPLRRRPAARRENLPAAAGVAALLLAMSAAALPGCTPPELLRVRSGLDSLRTKVDTLSVRDSIAFRVLQDARKELAEQRDILLSTRASTGSTTKELFDQMSRLQGKLDEVMGRFQQVSQHAPAETPGAANANQVYEQATQDLTQGRYALALQGYRDFLKRFPTSELSDDAQYGIGECQFAQSKFDSARTEYARVDSLYPQGDKVPAALYKQALSEEKLGRSADAKKTLEALVRRYPLSGEAQLAREKLSPTKRH
jgi:tol-pal system protein YbgF